VTSSPHAGSRRHPSFRSLLVALVALACLLVAGTPSSARADGPGIDAPAYIVVQPTTGDVVASRNPSKERLIASTTKIMTALVTVERMSLDDVLTVQPYAAGVGESLAGLRAGQRMRVSDLLRALLLPSGNDAAHTLAIDVGGSVKRFVRMMNAKARALGLHHTRFQNPVGLDASDNYSTARDLAKMGLVLLANPFLAKTVNAPKATLRSGPVGKVLVNHNPLVREVRWVNGVKTGHTNAAGYLLVASGFRDGVPVVSVVMGTSSEEQRDDDSLALLKYGLARYHRVLAVREGRRMTSVPLTHRDTSVALVAGATVRRVVRRGEATTTRLVGVPDEIAGPLPKGARVGTIEVRWRGRTVARVPLRTAEPVAEATLAEVVDDTVPGGIAAVLVLLAALVAGTLMVLWSRRRRSAARRASAHGAREERGVA
jgi:D-alanyl-D-alanine carboxypeptidase (penicillin-binding protein 5/6)